MLLNGVWTGPLKKKVPIQPKPGGGVEAAMVECPACEEEYYVYAEHDRVCQGLKRK